MPSCSTRRSIPRTDVGVSDADSSRWRSSRQSAPAASGSKLTSTMRNVCHSSTSARAASDRRTPGSFIYRTSWTRRANVGARWPLPGHRDPEFGRRAGVSPPLAAARLPHVPSHANPNEPEWRFGFLAALSHSARQTVLQRGRTRRYVTGEAIFHEGDPSEFAVVVLAGRLKVSSTSSEGHDTVLAFRGPGDLIGELSLFDGAPRSATVSAIEPADVVLITADRFMEVMREQAEIAPVLLRSLTAKLRDPDRRRLESGAYDTTGRVARRLVLLAEEHGETGSSATAGVRITLPLSQTELAGWTGSSREAVARALAQLRRQGLITTFRRSIVVLDLDSLRAQAG